jgi:hypothetical protein
MGTRPQWYLREREPRLGVGAELAGLVVYVAVIAAWVTVAGFGMAALFRVPIRPKQPATSW